MCQQCGHYCCDSVHSVTCETCGETYYGCGPEHCGCATIMSTTCDRCGKQCDICKNLGGSNCHVNYCNFCKECAGENRGRTELHQAVNELKYETIEKLLREKSELLNLEDMDGMTPLDLAIEIYINPEKGKYSYDCHCYDSEDNEDDEDLDTICTCKTYLDVVKLLLESKASFSLIDSGIAKSPSLTEMKIDLLETILKYQNLTESFYNRLGSQIIQNNNFGLLDWLLKKISENSKTRLLKLALKLKKKALASYLIFSGINYKDLDLPKEVVESVVQLVENKNNQEKLEELKKSSLDRAKEETE